MKQTTHIVNLISIMMLIWLSTGHAAGGKHPVRAALAAEVQPDGKTIRAAITFSIAPHWHLYWKNPGDAGLPIDVVWKLPVGFTAGEMKFPTPIKIAWGEAIIYGYEKNVTLLCDITASSPEGVRNAKISAEIEWLVCKESCIKGDTMLSVELGRQFASNQATQRALITRAQRLMPRPMNECPVRIRRIEYQRKRDVGKKFDQLIVTYDGTKRPIDFFPDAPETHTIEYSGIVTKENRTIIPLTALDAKSVLDTLRGIVIVGKRGYQIAAKIGDKKY